VTLTGTAPATTTKAAFNLVMPGGAGNASGSASWWDALQLEPGSTITTWNPGPSDPAGSPAPF
jgi:hypothetical protein